MDAQRFDWQNYLNLAKELASRSEIACLRSSVSRAYYYAYHLALARAKGNGFTAAPGGSTHVQLWNLYMKNPEPTCSKLGRIAVQLKEKRERADYEEYYPRIADDVPQIIRDVELFAFHLEQLPARYPQSASMRR